MPAQTDVAIIGAGPVGLFAAFQCGMLGLRSHVIDALPEIGGQCTALYPEKPIYDIPGLPRISGADLIANLQAQSQPFAPVYHCGQRVTRLDGEAGSFILRSERGLELHAGAVIIAAGAGAFGPNRPPLNGLEQFEETGAVQYLVRGVAQYRGKRVVIAGGGDSAVDWAIALQPVAAHVYMVHRRDSFRAAPESVARMRELAGDRLSLVVPFQLDALEGTDGHLQAVFVQDMDGQRQRLEADHLLAFFGLKSDLGALQDWELGVTQHRIPVQPASCATQRAGVFAIGDIAQYPGKLKLILSGFAEAAAAAHAIYPMLRGQDVHFEYSTSKGLPR